MLVVGVVIVAFLLQLMYGHVAELAFFLWSRGILLAFLWFVVFLCLLFSLLLFVASGGLQVLLDIEETLDDSTFDTVVPLG